MIGRNRNDTPNCPSCGLSIEVCDCTGDLLHKHYFAEKEDLEIECDDLRLKLIEAYDGEEALKATIKTLRDALEVYVGDCPHCGGEGHVDSGGQTPWGQWIDVECLTCKPLREALALSKETKA